MDNNVCLRRSLMDVALLVSGMYQEPRFPPPRVSVRSSKPRWQKDWTRHQGGSWGDVCSALHPSEHRLSPAVIKIPLNHQRGRFLSEGAFFVRQGSFYLSHLSLSLSPTHKINEGSPYNENPASFSSFISTPRQVGLVSESPSHLWLHILLP